MASKRLAPLIHARVGALVLVAQAQAQAQAADRRAEAGRQPFCYIPQEMLALLRQEAMLGV